VWLYRIQINVFYSLQSLLSGTEVTFLEVARFHKSKKLRERKKKFENIYNKYLDLCSKCRNAKNNMIAILNNENLNKGSFELLNTVNLKNAVFWDIETQFVPHRRPITSQLQSSAG
jgi:hypothetical protein